MSLFSEKPSKLWTTGGPPLFLMTLSIIPFQRGDTSTALLMIVLAVIVFAWIESLKHFKKTLAEVRKAHSRCEDRVAALERRLNDNETAHMEFLKMEIAQLRAELESSR